jgi:hypothetical protein
LLFDIALPQQQDVQLPLRFPGVVASIGSVIQPYADSRSNSK